jgi:threonine synthase
MTAATWSLRCEACGAGYPGLEVRYRCTCGGTLDVVHDLALPVDFARFDARRASRLPADRSGVWRFRELVLPLEPDEVVTRPEGNTNLYDVPDLARYVGLERLRLKHEGENPTGSFKDRGMCVAVTVARRLGMGSVACASTGNTSASMAAYAAQAGLRPFVFIPEGQIAFGKLSQSLAYGARTLQIAGDFDAAMALVEQACARIGTYLVNSVNPFRIEGQKAIAFELLQDLGWQVPDWIVLPGGNLGNSSAIAKGLTELKERGLIRRLPRLAVIQAAGANPLYTAFTTGKDLVPVSPARTRATAIQIGNPVSWRKCLRGLLATNGTVEQVTDGEILEAKARVDAAGIGAEPASCATVAGLRKLVTRGLIAPGETVCGILTGHVLKDPEAVLDYHLARLQGHVPERPNAPIACGADLESVLKAMSA